MSGSTESPRGFLSRRRFFRWASSLAATLGVAPLVSSATSLSSPAESSDGEDYYAKLGVAKIINAAGTYTTLTAACMPPEVLAAVQKAALHPVRLHELQRKAGEYIAGRLKCEGAVVTSGASGAISLAAAACLQYANNIKILDMPQAIDGMKNQVIVQSAHRYEYDRAMYLCGARVTEVVTLDDYKRACGEGKAVMTNFFNAAEDEDGIAASAQIGREEWLRVAHEYKIPCHLDAAADMPPISNLWKYTGMGFDLVAFSGGKGIRGPQNAGLLLGRKVLTDLAHANNNPGDGIGRGMKVAKEQIVGMVAAVDWVLSHTEESMQGDYQKRADLIADAVKGIPSVRTETVVPRIANHVPHLLIRFDPAVTGVTTGQIVETLRTGTPSIELNPNTGQKPNQGIPADANTLVVGVWMLQPGEDAIVGQRIRAALTKRPDTRTSSLFFISRSGSRPFLPRVALSVLPVGACPIVNNSSLARVPACTPRLCLSRRSRVKRLLAVLIMGSWLLSGTGARAQTPAQTESTTHVISNQDLDLLRKDLRSKRKQLIAANLKLTDTEAAKFWPVYDQYIAELITINDRKFALIQEYADNWGKLTNDQSLLFTRNWLDMDIAIAQLRQKYVPMVAKVLEGNKTATFFQLDRRIAMMMDLQMSSQMPLVQEQESSSGQSSSRSPQ